MNKENLKQLDESWEARNEKECDEINFRNLEDAKKMLDEFEQGQNYLKKQISGLTRQYIKLNLDSKKQR